ncbi:hypothetical protein [Xenorhabdus sp. KJ12.1]|uniref:hypothetical protein n=1 Tax=Xenorhabdus sp. KJ12.1 TaxID=1851571 RepID=UPI000C06271D|nr:hypothetical protein [Xenorhabdus sp. KJ12.1]PHM71829.1 hypothetical protein Xekj_01066 [Xenorhabdus sp. KJ12.1]
MKINKLNLYITTLSILLSCLSRGYANSLTNHSFIPNYESKNSVKNINILSSKYNLTFKNSNKYGMLKIHVTNDKCMKDHGAEYINLQNGQSYSENIVDYNTIFSCHSENKFVEWTATTYHKFKPYKTCNLQLLIYSESIFDPWLSSVNKIGYCNLEISATCKRDYDCLNHGILVQDGYSISIDIKDDYVFTPPKITSSDPQEQAQNNYITIMGQGFMEDESLPYLVTNFDQNKYKVKLIEEKRTQWRAKVWINCELTPRKISIEGIENSGITIKGPPCGATITSMKDAQIIPDGKYDISGLVNFKVPNDAKKIKVSISSFDDPDYTHTSEPTKEYTPDVDINSGTWSIKGLTAKCFNYYKASVIFQQNKKEKNNLSEKKEIKYGVARCPVKITKPVMNEFITSTDDNPKQIVIGGKVTEKTPLDIIVNYYSNGEHALPLLSRIGNNWQTKISDAPAGFIQIKAKNTGTPDVPIKNSNDEVTILKSKDFSVKYEIIDNGFIHIYGTSLPNNDKKASAFKETLHPKIIIFSDGVKSEEITPDEKGNWSSDNEYYAKRGVYFFTIHETSDNKNYPARKDKTLECTGGNNHMTCIEKNN